MKIKSIQLIILILVVLTSCLGPFSGIEISESKVATKELLVSRMDKKINLLFIYTSWCGISKKILQEEYSKLCAQHNDFSITVICADNKLEESQLNCEILGLHQQISSFPMEHRKAVKQFLQENFTNTEVVDLKGSFGIPISLFVSDDLEILGNAPQKSVEIVNLASFYRKKETAQ